MKVINRNIGTPMLSHYCPNCGAIMDLDGE